MPELQLWHWEELAPAIGNNKELPAGEQLLIRIKAGVSKARLEQFDRDRQEMLRPGAARPTAEQWAALLGDLVELARTDFTVEGRPIRTMVDYLELALEQASLELLAELLGAITYWNSVAGIRSFRYGPRSGGRATTSTGGEKRDAAADDE